MHVVTVAVVLVLGTATLLLHDKRFIQWKPTVLLALTAAAFLGSTVIGKKPLARRMLEGVFSEPLDISPADLDLHQLPVGRLVRAARWGEHLRGAKLYRKRVGELQGLRHQRGDDRVHDSPGHLAERQGQARWQSGCGAAVSRTTREDDARRLHHRICARRARRHGRESPARGSRGGRGGESHFRVRIVAEAFRGISPVARHRLVYAALADLMKSDIHALAIEALPPPGELTERLDFSPISGQSARNYLKLPPPGARPSRPRALFA